MKHNIRDSVTLLDAVMEIYRGVSKQKAKQIIGHSEFTLDGKKINRHPKQILPAGSELEIVSSEKGIDASQVPSHRNPVVIKYEDNFLIVALKPAGVLSCGNREIAVNNSFHKILEKYLSNRDEKKIRLWIIHRLDREVEGLLMFAKSEKIQQRMKEIWPQVTKKYLALSENKPDPPAGIIENWLKEGADQKSFASEREVTDSKYAKTEYRFIKADKSYFLVEALLHTGRKHQIRAHLAGINCPIVGDRKYGADDSVIRQIRLASVLLEFNHPVTGKHTSIAYNPPKRFYRPSETEDEKYRIL